MTDLLKILRLALYVVALPLAVTAVVSAESLLSVQDGIIDDSELAVSSASAPVALDVTHGQVNHVLHIDSAGGVSGRIMNRDGSGFQGAAGMDVSLNLRGEVIASSTTSNDGVFRFDGVQPGAYSFIATSPSNITTFGVYVFNTTAPADSEVQFSVAATGSNTSNVREILNSEIQSVSYSYTPSENEVVVTNEISQVELNADGAVTGRVFPLRWEDQGQTYDLTGNQVYLLDNSGVVANSPVNADGSYSLPDVAPGVYDFVSFGPHGAAALSIEVLGDDSVASNQVDASFASASSNSVALQGFDVVLSEPVVGVAAAPAVTVDVEVPLPQGGGGFGGGYGGGGYGGGGGGGGFGDFGGIISAALGAWVLAEAFKNNNNNAQVIQPPVVLPPPVIPPPVIPPPSSPF